MADAFVDETTFLSLIDRMPLVSTDLIIENAEGKFLLGQRKNRPAKGMFFVPGGRIRKNERLKDAFSRLCREELGLDYCFENAQLLGVYEHFYSDNFAGAAGISTHYVVTAYRLRLTGGEPLDLSAQHSESCWWSADQIIDSVQVHENTKAYFELPKD